MHFLCFKYYIFINLKGKPMIYESSCTIICYIIYFFLCLPFTAMAIDVDSNGQSHPHGISSSGLNTTINLQNNQYDITGGTQKGLNLFHSFDSFNVHYGESANFHDDGIKNNISRVTGKSYSWINGNVSSHAENLFLMNPNGWMFGPDASLDVAGSLHITSADYLILGDDDGRFDATNPDDSILTSAPVSAFGFIDNYIGELTIESKIEVHENKEIILVGGDIHVKNKSILEAESGKIAAVSVKSQGEVDALNIDEEPSSEDLGDVKINGGSIFSVNGEGAGDIYIRSENFYIGDDLDETASGLEAQSLGDKEGRGINVEVKDSIIISNKGIIYTCNKGDSKIDQLSIKADNLKLSNGYIFSDNYGTGESASLNLNIQKDLLITDTSKIESFTQSNGKSSDIKIRANNLMLSDSSHIKISSLKQKTSGTIEITCSNSLIVFDNSFINVGVPKEGIGGDIVIYAPNTILSKTTQISTINYDRNVEKTGNISITGDLLKLNDNSSITSSSLSGKSAGDIILNIDKQILLGNIESEVVDQKECFIDASGYYSDSGEMIINTGELIITDGSKINLASAYGKSSNLEINIDLLKIYNGIIQKFNYSENTNENLFSLRSTYINIYNNGIIECKAGGNTIGSKISIETNELNLLNGGKIKLETSGNAFGCDLTIDSDQINIIGDQNYVINNSYDHIQYQGMPGIISKTRMNGTGGKIAINSDNIVMDYGGQINFQSHDQASGSNLFIYSDNISLNNGAKIDGSSFDNSYSGNIYIESKGDINLKGDLTYTGILLNSFDADSSGMIDISSKNFVMDGAFVTAFTTGKGEGGDIQIKATHSIQLLGNKSHINSSSAMENEKPAPEGSAGNIFLEANEIVLKNGSQIINNTDGIGNAGNITIKASNLLHVSGEFSAYDDNFQKYIIGSGISNATFYNQTGAGNSGEIEIYTDQLVLTDGGRIDNSSWGVGNAGKVTINAEESIYINGGDSSEVIPSMIYSISGGVIENTENAEINNAGNGGDIYVNTKQLHIDNGGEISTSTESTTGKAGNIFVDATEKILLRGKLPSGRPSMIDSGSESLDSSGDGGEIHLSSQQLLISDGAVISSKNIGSGKANDIIINMRGDVEIKNSKILLEANKGDAGNIFFQSNMMLMNNSNVSTSVLGLEGDGGNITYDNKITLINKSQIIANAHEGTGGNITINSDHLIRSADSIIDASSKLGINGTVNILSPEIDLSSGLNALSARFMDASQWLNTPCNQRGDDFSSLIVNDRDSLPRSSDDLLSVNPYVLILDTPLGKRIYPMMTKGHLKEAVMTIESAMHDFSDRKTNIIANVILATIYMDLGFNTDFYRWFIRHFFTQM